MKEAKLAMAFHCYQPVDNFDREVEKAYESAYLPLMRTLEEFPGIKASFHFSGNLLEWLDERHPEYIEITGKLLGRGQIELVGGGCFEPVMALIPERDRREQILLNDRVISRIFALKPRGIWLAEKVWEPSLADTLVKTGMRYTIVDDYHLLQAGLEEDNVFRPCLTRGGNGSITLFPSLTRLRYSMPFRLPSVTLDYIRRVKDRRDDDVSCFFFADDGEKFGAWPHTYKWVYGKGWLRDFFRLLEKNESWLRTATYSEVMDTVPPREIGEVPESSYAEMMEWSDGNFKNFLNKYPEADRMHKRMLSLSDKIEEIRSGDDGLTEETDIEEARTELFKAQTSCAYWHGTFGGLYLPHLRDGVYRHLIKAQNIIDGMEKKSDEKGCIRAAEHELGEGRQETVIRNKDIDVFIRSFNGGAVSELDYKDLNLNLTNTMSRTREAYHEKLRKDYAARAKDAKRAILRGDFADVHDILGIGEKRLKKILYYDDYQRASFLTHIFRDETPWDQMHKGSICHDRFLKGKYYSNMVDGDGCITQILTRKDKLFIDKGKSLGLKVIKKICVGSGPFVSFEHKVVRDPGIAFPLRYAVEFNFSIYDKNMIPGPRLERTKEFSLEDKYSGLCLDFKLNRRFPVFIYPVYTVNETESGLKKTFQGLSVMIGDEVGPSSGEETADVHVKLGIR